MEQQMKHTVSSTPHIRSNITISRIMLLVLIALAPASITGVYFFGFWALLVIIVSVVSCVIFEALYQKITKQDITVNDYSAAVTGLLLALTLPGEVPLWMPVVGSFVAIVVAKQLFGGLGQNFINPALAGRAFLVASYMPNMVGVYVNPEDRGGFFYLDAVTSATPLEVGEPINHMALFLGNHAGTIGETSAIALIIGGLFLVFKKIITWHIPATFIVTVFVLTFFLEPGFGLAYPLFHILAGGLMLGAFFMATDYSSSPITPVGKLIMGFGCGFITVLIRLYGGYPEGVLFAILLMNLCVPLIDKFTKPRVFGTKKLWRKES